MFRFFVKHKLFFDILACIVFGLGSLFYFIEYFTVEFRSPGKENMKLFGAIIFALMFLFKLVDSVEGLKKRRTE